MARRPKAAPAAAKRGAKAPERDTKARSRKAAPAPALEVEVVEEERGLGIDEGLIILTTLIFLGAVLVTDYALGTHYGVGLFFKP